MNNKNARHFFAFLLTPLVLAAPAVAQSTRDEMLSFPMPPASGYAQQKTFGFAGDYGYYMVPSSSRPGGGVRAADYTYVKYSGVAGKNVYIYGAWGDTSIPDPVWDAQRGEWRDSCGHAHTSFGVWYRRKVFFTYIWSFWGGGSMSGVRNSAGRCVMKVNNPNGALDARFGWGKEFLQIDLRQRTDVKDLVLGVQSNTHGWGSCNMPGFKACLEPSWSIAYTLP